MNDRMLDIRIEEKAAARQLAQKRAPHTPCILSKHYKPVKA